MTTSSTPVFFDARSLQTAGNHTCGSSVTSRACNRVYGSRAVPTHVVWQKYFPPGPDPNLLRRGHELQGSCFLWMRSGEAGCTVGRRCSASRGRVFGGSSASRSEFGALAYTSAADAVLEGTKTSEAGEEKTAGASFTSSFTCVEIWHASGASFTSSFTSAEIWHAKFLTVCLLSSRLRVHIPLLRNLSFPSFPSAFLLLLRSWQRRLRRYLTLRPRNFCDSTCRWTKIGSELFWAPRR